MSEPNRDTSVAGRIQAVVYRNDDTGYAVVRLLTAEGAEVTAVGCIPFPAPGEGLYAEGRWTTHPTHGEQFSIESQYRQLPAGGEAIFDYLASGVIRGIGPATARLLVERFGEQTLDVLEQKPDLLTEIKGISAHRAREIGQVYRSQNSIQRLMELLLENELSPALAVKLYRRYGEGAGQKLGENPYLLLDEGFGVDFDTADALAQNLGVNDDSPLRMEAACLYTLRYNAEQGHVFIPRPLLLGAAAEMADCGEAPLQEALDRLAADGRAVCERVGAYDACYARHLYDAECDSARRLGELARWEAGPDEDAEELLTKLEQEQGITYAPRQREAALLAVRRRVMVLTGGPGTGKTTTVRAIIGLFRRQNRSVALAAPTGRAAKRLGDVTGREAKTVHRLLEMGMDPESGELRFQRDGQNPLDADAVIVDEFSMVDILLLHALLRALKPGAHLILVGDADQLPAVGPGQVLEDVRKLLSCVRLTEIFRQAAQSKIVMAAHGINRGELPELKNAGGDMFFLRRTDPETALQTILELCAKRLPERMGLNPEQIQVMSPTRRAAAGTVALNAALQAALNPPAPDKAELAFGKTVFREGDRVMQTRNNYDLLWRQEGGDNAGMGVYNGDVGVVTLVDVRSKTLTVRFEDRLVDYAYDQLVELETAFAMTVHKSQGSEYDAVVLAALPCPRPLMTRRVLYTAVTRAKSLLVIVGDEQVLRDMCADARKRDRYSGLAERLTKQLTVL